MPTGGTPTATANVHSVTITWPAASMANGTAAAGYVITRINAINGSPATIGASCSGVVTATSCTETSVPSGTWIYTDTPIQMSWTGTASSPSNSVST